MIRSTKTRSGRWRTGTLALLLTACVGCGNGAPSASSSNEDATVHGTVLIDGKPAQGGKVTFKSANVARNSDDAIADIGEDGSYTIKTKLGENIIRVTPAKTNKRGGMYSMDVFEVKSGDNPHDVKVTKH